MAKAKNRALRHRRKDFLAGSPLQRFEIRDASRVAQHRATRQRIENRPSANRQYRRKLPHDKAVTGQYEKFVLQF